MYKYENAGVGVEVSGRVAQTSLLLVASLCRTWLIKDFIIYSEHTFTAQLTTSGWVVGSHVVLIGRDDSGQKIYLVPVPSEIRINF